MCSELSLQNSNWINKTTQLCHSQMISPASVTYTTWIHIFVANSNQNQILQLEARRSVHKNQKHYLILIWVIFTLRLWVWLQFLDPWKDHYDNLHLCFCDFPTALKLGYQKTWNISFSFKLMKAWCLATTKKFSVISSSRVSVIVSNNSQNVIK